MSYMERFFPNGHIAYDGELGSLYFYLNEHSDVCTTVQFIEDQVMVDLDSAGNVVGIEVLL